MEKFIGTKVIQAAPSPHADGREGYAVLYGDSYQSWSPKDVFDGAYRSMSTMTFGDAVHMLKAGKAVARAGWNGKGMHLELQVTDVNSKMTLPYIWMLTADGHKVPWLASQTDVLAEDWTLLA